MSGKRFRYALEPVRLTRQWALDELLMTLAGHNAAVAQADAALQALRSELEAARQHWLASQSDGRTLALEQFALLSRYLHDGAARAVATERQLAQLQEERDATLAQVASARRALDAVEEHRDGERDAFRRARSSGDFKLADDHWSVLQSRGEQHESGI